MLVAVRSSAEFLLEIRNVITGPLYEIAARFSRFLGPILPHDALAIFTLECTGRPRKLAGDPEIVGRITIEELETLKRSMVLDTYFAGAAQIGGAVRDIQAVRDRTDSLLVLVRKSGQYAGTETDTAALKAAFGIVATSIQQQVTQASPDYLAEARAASSERARIIAELSETHATTLASILATLRSNDLDDRRSRTTAAETASAALVDLRSANDTNRTLSEEAVTTAFARLRGELRPLLRHSDAQVEYVEPPADGRPLPGEVAHAARALVRAIVLAFAAQTAMTRLRIAWDCDGSDLLIEVRDQGNGGIDRRALARQLSGRVRTLNGRVDIEAIDGWGSRVTLNLPLDAAPAGHPDDRRLTALNPRELEVLSYLTIGNRNKAIADELRISESTVKFHVAGILKKLEVANRSAAAAIGIRAGLAPDKATRSSK
ncbi:LuxR C-terminal-related transcriptional regulator [Nocardia sp. R6R-6]|uniref:LuxR C-terminal-related transcriptional regulator n=1 Tax=Nocardia sp. R6R-6 TaxID=3459303 RepID=UPI00403DAC5B